MHKSLLADASVNRVQNHARHSSNKETATQRKAVTSPKVPRPHRPEQRRISPPPLGLPEASSPVVRFAGETASVAATRAERGWSEARLEAASRDMTFPAPKGQGGSEQPTRLRKGRPLAGNESNESPVRALGARLWWAVQLKEGVCSQASPSLLRCPMAGCVACRPCLGQAKPPYMDISGTSYLSDEASREAAWRAPPLLADFSPRYISLPSPIGYLWGPEQTPRPWAGGWREAGADLTGWERLGHVPGKRQRQDQVHE